MAVGDEPVMRAVHVCPDIPGAAIDGNSSHLAHSVIPAKAGIQDGLVFDWIPAFAGMTGVRNGEDGSEPGHARRDFIRS